MAKMFYTMEEAAEKLGISEDEVREFGTSGQLQVFRDRDRMMFKRDQVDELAESQADDSLPAESISLQDSGDTAAMDLADDNAAMDPKDDLGTSLDASHASGTGSGSGISSASGISVFESDEVDSADPLAKTQVSEPAEDDEEDELVLESIGSGSGLLDLTREEEDDTSLGSGELLDEISVSDSGADIKVEAVADSSGAFESALETDAASTRIEGAQAGPGVVGVAPLAYGPEPHDPAGSGLLTGMLLASTICLVTALVVAIYAVAGVDSTLTNLLAQDSNRVMISGLVLLVGSVALGAAGFVLGKVLDK